VILVVEVAVISGRLFFSQYSIGGEIIIKDNDGRGKKSQGLRKIKIPKIMKL
jgi:hypothetical protein